MKNTSVFGVFRTRAQVENAVRSLKENGFRPGDVSVLLQENGGNQDFGVEYANKSPEGAAAGGATGAAAGGVLGWLAGIGALAIPGVGPFIAAGPIMTTLAGMGAGAILGGATGALVGIGIPEYEARRYEGMVKQGGILMSIHCDDSEWTARAKRMLTTLGASDVSSSSEAPVGHAKPDRPQHTGAKV